MLLDEQANINGLTPMPTDRIDDASTVSTSTSETVTWFYVSSGAWTSATGEAAGTVITGKLTFSGVLNSMNSALGSFKDTSLSWAAATRLSNLVNCPEDVLSRMVAMNPTDQKATISDYLSTNGDYVIDHRRGQIWAKSKATVADDSATYDYMAPIMGSGGPSASVNVASWGGNTATGGAGAVAAGTPRVTLASDDPAVALLTTIDADTSKLPALGTAAMAASAPVTIATDDTMITALDAAIDAMSAKFASGTVIGDVNLGATDNAVLDTIAADTTSLDAKAPALGTAAMAGSTPVTIATDDTMITALDAAIDAMSAKFAGGTIIGDVNLGATDNAVLDSIVTNTTGLAGTVSGSELQVDVVASLPAGSNLVGDVGIQGRATGGASTYYDADLDETAVAVKASAGTIYAIQAFNTTAAPLFLQIFNVAVGSVTVGTTAPTQQFVIPGNADSDGAGFTFNVPQGKAFGTAITVACTTNSEGSGAPGAGACIINIDYV